MNKELVISEIQKFCPLSEIQVENLCAYVELLKKWNKSINLIRDEENIWTRHILDCAQLIKFIPKNTAVLTDFGSGAGLPALVLAIVADEGHIRNIHVIESVTKKANFLNEAVRVCGLRNVSVHNQRIEELKPWQSDVITARAFAPLDQLFGYIYPFYKKDGLCILNKGCNLERELVESSKNWQFSHSTEPSISGDGVVFRVNGLIKNVKKSGL